MESKKILGLFSALICLFSFSPQAEAKSVGLIKLMSFEVSQVTRACWFELAAKVEPHTVVMTDAVQLERVGQKGKDLSQTAEVLYDVVSGDGLVVGRAKIAVLEYFINNAPSDDGITNVYIDSCKVTADLK